MKKNLILRISLITILIISCLLYIYRNDYFKGDKYYIKKFQKNNYIQYNGNIPVPIIINYNKNIKIVFWKDDVEGISCSFLEHIDREWVCIGGSAFGQISLNNLTLISYSPLNYKYKEINIWISIINGYYQSITLDNEHIFNQIPLCHNKYLIWSRVNNIPTSIPNYTPTITFYNNNDIVNSIHSSTI